MKRQDITTGPDDHYLLDSSQKWAEWASGGHRCRVVSTEKWSAARFIRAITYRATATDDGRTYQVPDNWTITARGNGLLVEVLTFDGSPLAEPSLRIAPPTQIKAKWNDAVAARKAHKDARDAANARASQRNQELQSRREALATRLGVPLQGYRLAEFTMTLDDAEALADRLGL